MAGFRAGLRAGLRKALAGQPISLLELRRAQMLPFHFGDRRQEIRAAQDPDPIAAAFAESSAAAADLELGELRVSEEVQAA